MSGSGRKAVARPDAAVENTHYFFQYGGGTGGGGCVVPLGVEGVALELLLPKYIARTRRIVFENMQFFGVRIYTNGGSDGFCANSLDTEVPFYMALSKDGLLTGAEVMEQGVELSGALPYEIEFLADKIPQPKDDGYTARIFVQLYWGDSGYINELGIVPTLASMRVAKHDYDIAL